MDPQFLAQMAMPATPAMPLYPTVNGQQHPQMYFNAFNTSASTDVGHTQDYGHLLANLVGCGDPTLSLASSTYSHFGQRPPS